GEPEFREPRRPDHLPSAPLAERPQKLLASPKTVRAHGSGRLAATGSDLRGRSDAPVGVADATEQTQERKERGGL
ncbi:MAG: hypothetical protein AVDCRST_MAG86-4356, partial [uncultured Truepera sp.]